MEPFEVEVLTVMPATNPRGDRLVRVTLGFESMPTAVPVKERHVPEQVHSVHIPGIQTPPMLRTPLEDKILLYFTIEEWNAMGASRFVVGDKYKFSLKKGVFTLVKA